MKNGKSDRNDRVPVRKMRALVRRKDARVTGISSEAAQAREERLKRGLSQRQLTMTDIGDAIGTCVFMGSGLAIGYAGPGALLSYVMSAAIAIAVTMVLAGRAWLFSVIIGVAWLALTVIAFVLGRHIRNAT